MAVKSSQNVGQPPLGGCVLKPIRFIEDIAEQIQPPLGGCVLKRGILEQMGYGSQIPAAFRRLCVETRGYQIALHMQNGQPPLGGCVLKHDIQRASLPFPASRL